MKHRQKLAHYQVVIPGHGMLMPDPEFRSMKTTWHLYDSLEEAAERGEAFSDLAMFFVSKNPHFAYLFASRLIQGRFPDGEATLAQFPEYAYAYAVCILKDRFLAAEEMIARGFSQSTLVMNMDWTSWSSPYRKAYLAHFPEARSDWVILGWISWFD